MRAGFVIPVFFLTVFLFIILVPSLWEIFGKFLGNFSRKLFAYPCQFKKYLPARAMKKLRRAGFEARGIFVGAADARSHSALTLIARRVRLALEAQIN